MTGLKSSLAVKIYGEDLNILQDKAIQIKNTLSNVPGFTELTVVRELGQPSLRLVLLGVSVETAVILVSHINKLRLEGMDIRKATREASLLRLRPIMMTALVACLGLLPAALSTGIGSDTQRPFAIVIVAGLISRLFIGFFVNPVLYEMVAREGDVLQV